MQDKKVKHRKKLAGEIKMYRRNVTEQIKLDIPFGVELDAENRWVELSAIIPWEKIDKLYSQNFKKNTGEMAKSSRLAFGALYIQHRLAITDEETVAQIQENPSMQYFCGMEYYTTQKPFDSSLMVHFRKRITSEMMKEITAEAFAAEAKKKIMSEERNKNKDDDDENNSGKPKGIMLLDATCCPSNIHYPTDISLLNHARELTEIIIDELHEQLVKLGVIKPRTYREVARKAYLSYSRKRKHGQGELRLAIKQQLQYVRRNLESIEKQVELGAELTKLTTELYEKLQTIAEILRFDFCLNL